MLREKVYGEVSDDVRGVERFFFVGGRDVPRLTV